MYTDSDYPNQIRIL